MVVNEALAADAQKRVQAADDHLQARMKEQVRWRLSRPALAEGVAGF